MNTIRVHFKNKRDVKGMLYKAFPEEKFNKAGERYFCARLVDKYGTWRNITIYTAANLVYDPSIWFHSMETEECQRRYHEARRVLDAPLHFIEQTLRKDRFSQLLSGEPIPLIITKLNTSEITPEVVCLMETANPFLNTLAKTHDNIVVESIIGRLLKYRGFCVIQDSETRDRIKTLIQTE